MPLDKYEYDALLNWLMVSGTAKEFNALRKLGFACAGDVVDFLQTHELKTAVEADVVKSELGEAGVTLD